MCLLRNNSVPITLDNHRFIETFSEVETSSLDVLLVNILSVIFQKFHSPL